MRNAVHLNPDLCASQVREASILTEEFAKSHIAEQASTCPFTHVEELDASPR